MGVSWVSMGANSTAELTRYTSGLHTDSEQEQSTIQVKSTLLNEVVILATIRMNLKDYVH